MKIKLKEGMQFVSVGNDTKDKFTLKKWAFWDDSEEKVWCAFFEKSIYPLEELDLDQYLPIIDGIIINEPNEYIY